MSVLSKQFRDALSTIEPRDDAVHAGEAHASVREVLAADDELMEWGLHSILIGSYRREVSIRRVKDADVFCELPALPDHQDPQALLDKFTTVLGDEYGDRVSKNDRSVKVDFPDFDMHVDVVPARSAGDVWEIPDRDGGWQRTHPARFSELTTARNQDHDGQYVRAVKLLRQTRRALRADAKPGGFFVEVAAYHAFASIPIASSDGSPGSMAEYYTVALETMAPILRDHADGTTPLMNPALPDQEIQVRATQEELDAIADVWHEAASDARNALGSENDQAAARTFKRLLGKNSDGEDVFAVPAVAASVSAGHRKLPSGESPTFG